MNTAARATTLAPFHFKAFRFQWPADLATSCAFEMETLILSWYILVETRSVFLLTAFMSLQYLGTLISPLIGVVGDRIGPRYLLSGMRIIYATLAFTLLGIILVGALSPVYVFIISALIGLVRPSDMGMRVMLLGAIVPSTHFVGAVGIQRTTMDIARIGGAIAGAAIVAALGMTAAYATIAALYTISFGLTIWAKGGRGGSTSRAIGPDAARPSPWRDLKEGARYVWSTPLLFGTMCFAFVINLTAFPQLNGLLPYVAKEIYGTTQTGLGYMIAAAGTGACAGSVLASHFGRRIRPARTMIFGAVAWYLSLITFAQTTSLAAGIAVLVFTGFASSASQVPMQAMLLRQADEEFRGRVMGIRMLAIYGNMLGLLLAGPLIAAFGYAPTAVAYCLFGIGFAIFVAAHWGPYVWRRDAPANAR